ncbi:MAG: hypothetical protein HY806_07160, partial [Nitrospirae bacterium]|nr:hypothetical protein [Nitrospirota bacterium]
MDKPASETACLKKEIKRLRRVIRSITPDLKTMLSRRGFYIYKKESKDDLLVPSNTALLRQFYAHLKKYSFRLFLRDVIKYQESFSVKDVARYAAEEVTRQYIGFLIKAHLAESIKDNQERYHLIKRPIKSFGET